MDEIKLSPKKIVDKRFKVSMQGYNRKEVDAFLDQVIQDYENYEKKLAALQSENERLTKQNQQVAAATATPKNDFANANFGSDMPTPGTTNYDILKRLSNLERHVFGQTEGNAKESLNKYPQTNFLDINKQNPLDDTTETSKFEK